MPKKPDLSKAFGERFKTEEKVDVQDPIAAAMQATKDAEKDAILLAGLPENKDARMHAYTSDVIPESMNVSINEGPPAGRQARRKVPTPAREQASKTESKPTRKPANQQESKDENEQADIDKGVLVDMLYDQIQQKKHLSNGSFRYRADELEKLEAIYRDLDRAKPGRISKNDIARLALIAFYEDYEQNGDESILAQVFKRM
ncbi:MAG TPA: hypothetical protein VHV10_04970 [Ktedonobacteraceae bacterium]|jgi:hypothetical protein|nr:hypothetical protein [Ktedonobacteraceae bacterium]